MSIDGLTSGTLSLSRGRSHEARHLRSAALHGKQYSGARYCVAMSEENVKTVRDAAEAFNRGDLDTWAGYLADDIDYRAVEGAPDDHGPIHGKEAIRAYLQDWQETFDDFTSEPVELIDAGEDNVVAVIRISGRAKLSGVETDLTYAALYTLRDGKVARGREYWTREEALEAAGVSE